MNPSTRRTFLGQVTGAAIASSLPQLLRGQPATASGRRPNILLIMSDDMRPELHRYGVDGIKTPGLDALAARSLRFNHAYVQYPLCNPSRSSMFTGRYPTQTGVMDNRQWWGREHPDWKTLPRWFRDHGYLTMRTGKIFHDGIDDETAWVDGGQARRYPADASEHIDAAASGARAVEMADADPSTKTQTPEKAAGSDRFIVLDGDGSDHPDYLSATKAIGYLQRGKESGQPFFVACGFSRPHSPPQAPKRFFDLYDVDKVPLPVDFAHHPTVPAGFPELSVVPKNLDLFIGREASEAQAREMKRAYWASVSFVDEQVGRVVHAVDELKLADDTIIIFCADHGYHLGEKGRWSKAYSAFDVALRVPLLISVPGAAGNGQTCERSVEMVNLYHTCCDLCGVPAPDGIEGTSLQPLLRNPDVRWDRPAYSVVAYRDALARTVRTDHWRYTQWVEGERGEVLFDEQNDPHELKNLAADPQHAGTLAEMKALLKKLPGRTR